MSFALDRSTPRRIAMWCAAAVVGFGGISNAFAQAASCQVTYTKSWEGGNGFGANIVITNNGPTINGWTLQFDFPNGQRLQHGWPVSFSQPANSATVTVASNADWNRTIATGSSFTVGFNGTFNGANNSPTRFTLNGTVCNGDPGNTPPMITLTSPTSGQSFPAGSNVTLAANASDPGGAVVRVEFRVDGNLVATDTSAPYSFTATGLSSGNHSVVATAFDNGTPSLSTSTGPVPFTIQTGGNQAPTVTLTAPTSGQTVPGPAVTLTASASDPDGAVSRVEFRVDGSLVATDTTAPYSATVTVGAGSHTAQATAFDNGNPQLSASTPLVPFTVSGGNTPPSVTLTAPTSGQNFPTGSSVTLTATASDPGGAVTRVEFRIDGALVGTDTAAPYSFTATGLAAGSHTAQATAFDNGSPSLSTSTAAVPFTIGTQSTGRFRVDPTGRITKNGQPFPIRCGNWFGLEGRHEPSNDQNNPSGAPMELYIGNTFWANGGQGTGRTMQQTMTEITGMGINVVRLPVVPQTLDPNDPQGTGNVLKNHPSVRIANSRMALEEFIRLADQNNIEVMLDVHSCSNYVGWRAGRLDARPPYVDRDRENYDFTREAYSCAATNNPPSVTTVHPYNTAAWLDTLRTLAGLEQQLGVDNIIGIDIFNEPWDYTWQDWKSLTEQAYDAINAVNPNILLFVQGISATANNQDGTPDTITQVPHGDANTNPNWGENLFEAGANPIDIPKERLVFSPHTYGPSVFVQKMFMDPAQPECAGLEGDVAGDNDCNIVINPTILRAGWEEHFGYLRDQGYAVVVGEFGGNMDWPLGQASIRDRNRWSHITPGTDEEWQNAFVDYMIDRGIEACYWSINPESGDTAGWYQHAYDPISNTAGWGEWRPFDTRKTTLLQRLWGQ